MSIQNLIQVLLHSSWQQIEPNVLSSADQLKQEPKQASCSPKFSEARHRGLLAMASTPPQIAQLCTKHCLRLICDGFMYKAYASDLDASVSCIR